MAFVLGPVSLAQRMIEPSALVALARLWMPPGSTPRSTRPVDWVQRKARLPSWPTITEPSALTPYAMPPLLPGKWPRLSGPAPVQRTAADSAEPCEIPTAVDPSHDTA